MAVLGVVRWMQSPCVMSSRARGTTGASGRECGTRYIKTLGTWEPGERQADVRWGKISQEPIDWE